MQTYRQTYRSEQEVTGNTTNPKMAQALVSLDKDDETLVINTKISDRVWLQSPSTTTFSNDDKNLTKMLALYAKRDNDDESLTFIFEKAWKIFLLSRKTENLPEQVATEVEHALNTTNNIALEWGVKSNLIQYIIPIHVGWWYDI